MQDASRQNRPSLEDKLFTVCRKEYGTSHIKLEPQLCKECSSRICVRICPAGVYEWDDIEEMVKIKYENCLECGTCMVACEMHNIEWSNPVGGRGVIYRNS